MKCLYLLQSLKEKQGAANIRQDMQNLMFNYLFFLPFGNGHDKKIIYFWTFVCFVLFYPSC